MDATAIAWAVYIPIIYGVYLFTLKFICKLRNFPPIPALNLPIFGHLYLVTKPLHRSLAKISHRYGPVLLLHFGSRRVLLVSSPSAAEDCLSKNDVIFANRPKLIAGEYLGCNYTSLAWASYGDHWRNLRKISSIEVLSTHRLQTLQGIRREEVKSMVRSLIRASDEGKSMDMKRVLFETLMNVMMRMIAGKRFYGEDVSDVEEASRFRDIVVDTFRYGGASNLGDFVPVLRWLGVGWEKKLMELQKRRDGFMQDLVSGCGKRMRNKEEGKRETMIEMLLELQQTDPEYYTDSLIKSLMLVLLSAGTDTTVSTLEWGLALLLNNPEALRKAQIEIDSVIGHSRLLD